MFSKNTQHRFKFDSEFSFDQRKSEADRILLKYPDRVPIIVEPSEKCKIEIDKKKYLVPSDLSMGQFLFVIRKRLKLPAEKALFMFIGSHIPSSSSMLSLLYDQHVSPDGFLKITFSEENVFG
jgi:GABA(A) receptor-associated protein